MTLIQTKLQLLLLIYLTLAINIGIGQFLKAGECSRTCQKRISVDNETISEIGSNSERKERFALSQCSCTSSCTAYRDCCYDSEFRTQDQIKTKRMACLTLSNRGQFKAVAKCSNGWTESSVFCTEGVGHLPPVTSKRSGITYANTHCAICNEDAEDLVTWNVELRCCEEHDNLEDQSGRRFVYRDGHLQSMIQSSIDNIRKLCICKFYVHEEDYSSVDTLELRSCDPRLEISKCSSTWWNETVQQLCESFLDPVYTSDKVYRNVYCAQCNFERLDLLSCTHPVVQRMFSEGKNDTDILSFCDENGLLNCAHILNSITGRGRPYAFSSLLNTNEQGCYPEKGRRCCDGERYDFRSKRCRKLH